ncbi:hypothetical protein PN441_16120 [Spirulina major CS-329]|jgi:hypothetical protein|uniref:hypothetical protein n=1 Tax=Spirulina TaxID=1154 RepID=UPI00232C87DD|nr:MULTISPECIES: hypothetical protein [Spirulina]MDB9495112.1 hypothetical protein [Spirulina subsalsa CS-330]MDB9504605.1 hypothetical protein [Spirulina major CS-329]
MSPSPQPKKEGKKYEHPIFVHQKLDDAGFDVYEFRMIGHIARRGRCYSALPTIANKCKMSIRKAQVTLKSLVQKKVVNKQVRKGRTAIYEINPSWEDIDCFKNTEKQDLNEDELLLQEFFDKGITPEQIESLTQAMNKRSE